MDDVDDYFDSWDQRDQEEDQWIGPRLSCKGWTCNTAADVVEYDDGDDLEDVR